MQAAGRETDSIAVRLWEFLFYCTLAGVLGLGSVQFAMYFTHPMLAQSDQCMYLSMADLLLQGRMPYVQCYDNNPPLIIYLNVIPVVVASLFKMPICYAFSLCITFFAIAGSLLSLYICRLLRGRLDGLLVMAATLGYALFNHHQELDLGQREHLFVIAVFPFILVRYLRYRDIALPRWLSIVTGLLAGVGIALKHYFLLITLACELTWLNRRGSLKMLLTSENFAASAVIALYLLHFLFLPREMVAGFFDFVVPIYKVGYGYYTNSFVFNVATFWRNDFVYLALVSLAGFVLVPLACDGGLLLLGLIAFAWMSTSVFVFAGQSWQYHLVPIRMATSAIGLMDIWILLGAGLTARSWIRWLFAAVLAILPFNLIYQEGQVLYQRLVDEEHIQEHFDLAFLGYKGSCFEYELSPAVKTILANTTKSDTVLFLSSAMAPGYPAMIQSERRPASRFIHGMLFTVLDYDLTLKNLPDRAKFLKFHQQVVDWYIEDIDKNKPKLIFVQIGPLGDVLQNMQFYQKHMANYDLIGEDYGMKIYKRREDGK